LFDRAAGILPSRPHVTIAVAHSECQGRRFFSGDEGLALDPREHGGTLPVAGWLPHGDPRETAIGHEQSRAKQLAQIDKCSVFVSSNSEYGRAHLGNQNY
jgi:hypothetical protein